MNNKTRKIGIMGGTFNPIHQGHLLLAEEARDYCNLDEILFMPSGFSYMKNKKEIASNEARKEMTLLAIKENPSFYLSTLEMEREGATYTCETLEILKKRYPLALLYFILGADNLFSIEKWKNPEQIMQGFTLIVAARGAKTEEEILHKAEELKQNYRAKIQLLPERTIDLSSSEIRERIKNGQSVRYMLPDKVFAYIEEHGLYQDS